LADGLDLFGFRLSLFAHVQKIPKRFFFFLCKGPSFRFFRSSLFFGEDVRAPDRKAPLFFCDLPVTAFLPAFLRDWDYQTSGVEPFMFTPYKFFQQEDCISASLFHPKGTLLRFFPVFGLVDTTARFVPVCQVFWRMKWFWKVVFKWSPVSFFFCSGTLSFFFPSSPTPF